jgi:hypothetical protein
MAAEVPAPMGESSSPTSLSVDGDRPLVGVPGREDGREVVRYFVEEPEGDTGLPADVLRRARAAVGSWSDMDWEETRAALDRIRHESEPTPPIDLDV